VTARLPFEPEFFSRAAPISHQSALQGQRQRFVIHPGKHQNPPNGSPLIGSLLNDYGNQPVICKFKIEVHGIASPVCLDNLTAQTRQHKEMSETSQTNPPANLRFRQCPVKKIRLRLVDLARFVSPEYLFADLPEEDFIEINAHSTLRHIVPKISIRELAMERPDLFCPVDEFIKLPTQCLAKAYRLHEESYELGSEFSPEKKSAHDLADHLLDSTKNLTRLSKTKSSLQEPSPDTAKILEPIAENLQTISTQEASHPEPESTPASDQPHRLLELIQRLPTFHRIPPASSISTLIEPLVLETNNFSTDLPDQENLQSLFLTDEKLTVRRVVELCGDLPGIRSCVLTCEESVIASHNVPENFDLVALSSTASKMLRAMQEPSSHLGIGAIPALTLHTERGPLSIVQNNRLTMLVIHADRGFIPGVREKLTAALNELSHAPLALPSAAPLPMLGMPLPPDSESL
jgi:predicted regulator of Ras-like GTPase activity (Roadblock/LC7/MglB family)